MPADYNHNNPSGEAELVFGQGGSPVKAEYGTAVHDLSAGRFQGIPQQAGLRETIEAGVARARKDRKK
ncbi:MAG: hypothetical protein ABW250_26820 [Pyrinomonadaceae bacterium]